MADELKRYRKKPVVVDAVRWPGQRFESAPPKWFTDAMYVTPGAPGFVMRIDDDIIIHTLEGQMRARPGDWIIRGVQGELHPCKPDIFAATYEEASPVGDDGLPPLPQATVATRHGTPCHTAEQVRQAQREAVGADRARMLDANGDEPDWWHRLHAAAETLEDMGATANALDVRYIAGLLLATRRAAGSTTKENG